MNIEVYANDGSKIILEAVDFDAKKVAEQMNMPQVQVLEIGGAILSRHAFQFILPAGTERIYPNREGQ